MKTRGKFNNQTKKQNPKKQLQKDKSCAIRGISSVKVECSQTIDNKSGHHAKSIENNEKSDTSPCYYVKVFLGTLCFLAFLVFCYECLTLKSTVWVILTSGVAWFWKAIKSIFAHLFGLSPQIERELMTDSQPLKKTEDNSDSGSVISDKVLADAVDETLHKVTDNKAWSFINSIFSSK